MLAAVLGTNPVWQLGMNSPYVSDMDLPKLKYFKFGNPPK
jgi:hypothetical protein